MASAAAKMSEMRRASGGRPGSSRSWARLLACDEAQQRVWVHAAQRAHAVEVDAQQIDQTFSQERDVVVFVYGKRKDGDVARRLGARLERLVGGTSEQPARPIVTARPLY
jgi:hypothetical protein